MIYEVISLKGHRVNVKCEGQDIPNSKVVHAVRDTVHFLMENAEDDAVWKIVMNVKASGNVAIIDVDEAYDPDDNILVDKIGYAKSIDERGNNMMDTGQRTGWKFTRKDGMDWHTGEIDYRGAVGTDVVHPNPNYKSTDACGIGLHLGKSVKSSAIFCSAEAIFKCTYNQADVLGEDEEKVRVTRLYVVEELPSHVVYGDNGIAVNSFIDSLKNIEYISNAKEKINASDFPWADEIAQVPTARCGRGEGHRFLIAGNQLPLSVLSTINNDILDKSKRNKYDRYENPSLVQVAHEVIGSVHFSDIEKYEIDEAIYNSVNRNEKGMFEGLETTNNRNSRYDIISLLISTVVRRLSEVILGVQEKTVIGMAMDVIVAGHIPFQIDVKPDGKVRLVVL